jgi:predicted ATP-grasp superfamily ATP-dependent carboligase
MLLQRADKLLKEASALKTELQTLAEILGKLAETAREKQEAIILEMEH